MISVPSTANARILTGTHLYILQSAHTGAIKVGRSNDVEQRIAELQTGNPYRIKSILIATNRGNEERRVHEAMVRGRIRPDGEWFHEAAIGFVPDDIWVSVHNWYLEAPDWWKDYR